MKKKIMWEGFVRVIIPFIIVAILSFMFLQSCQKEELIEPDNLTLKSAVTVGALTFFTTPDDFPCTGLPTEDFEKATNAYPEVIMNPLDASTNTSFLPTGSILPGISIMGSRDDGPYVSGDLVIWAGSNNIIGHIVLSNHQQEKLIIEFTDDNVTSVSLRLLTIFWSDIATFYINLYGSSDVLLGSTTVVGGTPAGTYFGVQSESPIKKMTIYGFDHVHYAEVPEGIDDLMFGACNPDTDGDGINDDVDNCPNIANPNQEDWDADGIGNICDEDSDGDGCPDSNDAVIPSNTEKFVNIDGCQKGVTNKMTLTEPCGTMMSDVMDVLEKGTYNNHGAFVKEVSNVVNDWFKKGLINLEEKDALMACAGESTIGVKK